jgi:hypothetical protein
MDPEEHKKLRKKIALLFPSVLIVLGLILFVPTGTLDYWEAWLYCAALLVPFLIVVTYLLINDPELLARRIRLNEKESAQKKIIGVSRFIFFIIFLIPGLDHRFGWSDFPVVVVLAQTPSSSSAIRSYSSFSGRTPMPPESSKSNKTRR